MGAPCRYGVAGRPLRARLAGAGAAALVHGLALGAALAFSGDPSPPQQRDRTAITAITFVAPAPRPSGRGSAARPAAALHQSQDPIPTGVSTGISIAAPPALSPTVAAIVASVSPAPTAAVSAAPPVKADLSAQKSAYLHRIWLRIMACRPADLGLSGTVRLAFRLDETGALTHAQVVGPSGMALLDRAALQALRRAAPFPAPPEHMRPDIEDFEVEIRFG